MKKQIVKKLICFGLIAIFVIQAISAGLSVMGNSYFDGGFESVSNSSFSKWNDWKGSNASIKVSDSVKHSGSYSLNYKIEPTLAGEVKDYKVKTDSLSSSIILQANSTYEVSYWVKKDNINNICTFINIFDENNANISGNIGALWGGDCDWTNVVGTFKTGSENISASLLVFIYGADKENGGNIYIDDILLTYKKSSEDSVFDGDFEEIDNGKLLSWAKTYGTADYQVDSSVVKSGATSLKIERKNKVEESIVLQSNNPVKVKPNTQYCISYYGRQKNVAGNVNQYLYLKGDADFAEGAYADIGASNGDDWFLKYVCITTGEKTTTLYIQCCSAGMQTSEIGENGYIWFDDISVDEVPKTNLISNGSMENWLDVGTNFERLDDHDKTEQYWAYDASNFDGKNHPYKRIDGFDGFALQCTNTKSWLGTYYQDVTLEKNTNYQLSYYQKCNHTDVVILAYFVPANEGNDSGNKIGYSEKAVSVVNTWQKVENSFNSGNLTDARLVLRYYKSDATLNRSYNFCFDEVRLTKESLVLNGDFETCVTKKINETEKSEYIPIDWNYSIVPSHSGKSNDFKFEVKEDSNNKYISLTKKGSGYIAANSNPILVNADTSYELVYYVKANNAKNCASYVQVVQYSKTDCSKTVSLNAYSIPYQQYGDTSGFKKVVVYITTGPETRAMKLQATICDDNISTADYSSAQTPAEACFDNFSLKSVEAISPTDNFGFEYGETIPRDWSYQVAVIDQKDAGKTDKSKYSIGISRDAFDGVQALELTTSESYSYAEVHSPYVPIKSDTDYKLNFYVKLTGTSDSICRFGMHFYTKDGNSKNEWFWADTKYWANGATDGYVKLSVPFTSPSDATQMDIRILVCGSSTTALIDNISLDEVEFKLDQDLNMSFEDNDNNWQFTSNDGTKLEISSDAHNGEKSIHLVKNGVTSSSSLLAVNRFSVKENSKLMFGGYYKSKESVNSKIRINVNLYDENNKKVSTLYGRNVPLNQGDDYTDWKKLCITVDVPSSCKTAEFEIIVSQGKTDVIIDDLFYRNASESDESELVEFNDFSGLDTKGNLAGFSAQNGKLLQKKKNSEYFGEFSSNGKSAIKYHTEIFVPDNNYTVSFKYSFPYSANVQILFYDYMGKLLSNETQIKKCTASANSKFSVTFTAPSCVSAEIMIDFDNKADYCISDIKIYCNDVSNIAQSWAGKWVWYPEDTLKYAEKQHRYFVYTFDLNDTPIYAPMQISADDNFALYINGDKIGDNLAAGQDQWSSPETYDILKYLKKGKNTVAIDAYNVVSYAALIFDCRITLKNGETVFAISDNSVKVSKTAPNGWNKPGFDCSSWSNVKIIGAVPISPWGSIFFDTSLYADNKIEIVSFESPEYITAGTTISIQSKIRIEEKIDGDYPIEILIYKKNSTKQITSAVLTPKNGFTTSKWNVGNNNVEFTMYVPDYLETGRYTLQLSNAYLYLTNEDIVDNNFATINVYQTGKNNVLNQSEVKIYNGKSTLFINGEPTAPLMYLTPAGDVWWNLSKEQQISNSDTEIYVTNACFLGDSSNRTQSIWTDEDTIDYDTFDKYVYNTLSANPNAQVMIAIGMQAPKWWLDKHPDDEIKLQVCDSQSGKITSEYPSTRAVSFSSENYKKDASSVLRKLVKHISTAPYASHIIGIKIQDGETNEYMVQGAEDWAAADFSNAALVGFRKYLQKIYKTDSALKTSWNDKNVTIDTATIPNYMERGNDGYYLIDPSTNRKTIDYNYYLSSVSTDVLDNYGSIIKEVSDGKLLVSAYHGYVWNFNTAAGNGSTHPEIDRLLNGNTVDIFCSPFVYGERDMGESPAFDAAADSINLHGKLYILELDTRSVYDSSFGNADWDSDVGYCYTMKESVDSVKRDVSALIAKGIGFWFFNMYGSWWYDDQFMQLFSDIKEEMYFNTYLSTKSNSDVAVIIDEMMYPYISSTEVYNAYEALYYLLAQQRRSLAGMGASYDVYMMRDLEKGLIPDYKIYVFLSPYEVTNAEKKQIDKLKSHNHTLLFIGLPAISNGSKLDKRAIEELTGMHVELIDKKVQFNGTFVGGDELTNGIEGIKYGLDQALSAPLAYIDDHSVKQLAYLNYASDSYSACALKDNEDWTCIYSTVPNLPARFWKNLLKQNNAHIYSENTCDYIYANSNYVALYSLTSGKKTIELDGNYAVYDVFKKNYYSLNTNEISYEHSSGETRLFRLTKPNKISVLARARGGNCKLTKFGIEYVNKGDSFETKLILKNGYEIKALYVNGLSRKIDNVVSITNITDYQNIEFVVSPIKKLYKGPSSQPHNLDEDSVLGGSKESSNKTVKEIVTLLKEVNKSVSVTKTQVRFIYITIILLVIILASALAFSALEYLFVKKKKGKRGKR